MKVNVIEHSKEQNTHFLVIADLHEDKIDIPTYEIMKQYARIYGVERLIILGDFPDLDYLMPKNEGFKKWIGRQDGLEGFFIPKFEETMLWCNSILDELQLIFKEIHYLKGNHCQRVDYFREEFCLDEYKHHFDLSVKLNLAKRGIKIYEYNDWLDIGHASLTHGMYHSPTHFKNHFIAAEGKSVIIGHLHRHETMSFSTRGKAKSVTSIPCMCNLNPAYMKNKDNSWVNGFAHLIVKPNGHFNLNIKCVFDNELCLEDGRNIV